MIFIFSLIAYYTINSILKLAEQIVDAQYKNRNKEIIDSLSNLNSAKDKLQKQAEELNRVDTFAQYTKKKREIDKIEKEINNVKKRLEKDSNSNKMIPVSKYTNLICIVS